MTRDQMLDLSEDEPIELIYTSTEPVLHGFASPHWGNAGPKLFTPPYFCDSQGLACKAAHLHCMQVFQAYKTIVLEWWDETVRLRPDGYYYLYYVGHRPPKELRDDFVPFVMTPTQAENFRVHGTWYAPDEYEGGTAPEITGMTQHQQQGGF